MVTVSIICPFYNERDNLEELVERIAKTLSKFYDISEIELVMVDDGSTDNSDVIMRKLAEKYSSIKLITHNKKMGQAAALSSGFLSAGGDIVITMDADLQVFPEDLPLFLDKMNRGYDLVNGIRLNRKELLLLRLSSKFFSFLVSILLNTPIKDAASNFIAVRKEFVKNLNLTVNDHRYIIPIIKKRGAIKIAEVKVRHAKRYKGKSKYKLSKIISAVPELFSFYSRLKRGYYNLN
ncbi:MAG: glycosyltransferase family 2 protein [Candidatus Omnitrophota bacterium]